MKPKVSLLSALIHETVKVETFETYADLEDRAKERCARLRIPYDGRSIHAAVAQVEHTRGRVVPVTCARPPEVREHLEPVPVLSQTETIAILSRIFARVR
jgi:hypothetical protein